MPAMLVSEGAGTKYGPFTIEESHACSIGRDSGNDIPINELSVSRLHCTIAHQQNRWSVEDHDSRNGTFINGVRIYSAFVGNGDEVRVGKIALRFTVLAPGTKPSQGESTDTTPTVKIEGPPEQDESGAMPTQEVVIDGGKSSGRVTEPQPGQALGPYRLLEKIGEGAASLVFKAVGGQGEQTVALKVLRPHLTSDREMVKRFLREAAAGRTFTDPNLVRMFDHGKHEHWLYLAMEYVDGKTLAAWLDEMPPGQGLPRPTCVGIAMQVATALQHAFQKGIVHRDVKPGNILVNRHGRAKLADLGLAKWMDAAGISTLTQSHVGMGTLQYIPPEQIDDARNADIRSDLYSLGATLYHMVLATPPFAASTPIELIRRVGTQAPAFPLRLDNDAIAQLYAAIKKAMQKSPDDRYQTPAELLADLNSIRKALLDVRLWGC